MKYLPIYTLIAGCILTMIGAFFKIMKYGYSDVLLGVGMLLSFFSLVAIIVRSIKTSSSQKA